MITGATAFQLGTVNFINPVAAIEIIDGINNYCSKMELDSLDQLIGSRIV